MPGWLPNPPNPVHLYGGGDNGKKDMKNVSSKRTLEEIAEDYKRRPEPKVLPKLRVAFEKTLKAFIKDD